MNYLSIVYPVRRAGFSLIEMIVALAVGMVVVIVVSQMFSLNSKSNHETASLSRVQENARFALDLLGNDVRSAADFGCNGLVVPNINGTLTVNANFPAGFNVQRDAAHNTPTDDSVMAYTPTNANPYSVSNTGGVPPGLNYVEMMSGNDVLTIKRGDTSNKSFLTAAQTAPGSIIIDAANAAGFQNGDILLMQNCQNADLFSATSAPAAGLIDIGVSSSGTPNNFANGLYPVNSDVMRYVYDVYYIGSGTGSTSGPSCPSKAFCRKALVNGALTTEVLANNVESFHVMMGLIQRPLAPTNPVVTYETPTVVAAETTPTMPAPWCRVGTVQANLVFIGDDNLTSNTFTPYWLNGAQVTPAVKDLRLRRGYSQVFSIFSRQLWVNGC